MNAKKGFSVTLLLAAISLTAWALPPVFADVGDEGKADQAAITQHIYDMRTIMHFALVEPANIDQGVRVTVTGDNPELVAAIQREFSGDRHESAAPFPGVTVKLEALEAGAALVYTAEDAATVERLQTIGARLVYGELRNNMHQAMWANRGEAGQFGGKRGYGRMGGGRMGWGHGPGYGQGNPDDTTGSSDENRGWGPGRGRMGGGMGYGPRK